MFEVEDRQRITICLNGVPEEKKVMGHKLTFKTMSESKKTFQK